MRKQLLILTEPCRKKSKWKQFSKSLCYVICCVVIGYFIGSYILDLNIQQKVDVDNAPVVLPEKEPNVFEYSNGGDSIRYPDKCFIYKEFDFISFYVCNPLESEYPISVKLTLNGKTIGSSGLVEAGYKLTGFSKKDRETIQDLELGEYDGELIIQQYLDDKEVKTKKTKIKIIVEISGIGIAG